jgi:hypothetical protein
MFFGGFVKIDVNDIIFLYNSIMCSSLFLHSSSLCSILSGVLHSRMFMLIDLRMHARGLWFSFSVCSPVIFLNIFLGYVYYITIFGYLWLALFVTNYWSMLLILHFLGGTGYVLHLPCTS